MYVVVVRINKKSSSTFGVHKRNKQRLKRQSHAIWQCFEKRANLLAMRPVWMQFRTNHHTDIDFGRDQL